MRTLKEANSKSIENLIKETEKKQKNEMCGRCKHRIPYTYCGNHYLVSDKWCEYYEEGGEVSEECEYFKFYLPR